MLVSRLLWYVWSDLIGSVVGAFVGRFSVNGGHNFFVFYLDRNV